MPKAALTYRKLAFADTGDKGLLRIVKAGTQPHFYSETMPLVQKDWRVDFFWESGCAME